MLLREFGVKPLTFAKMKNADGACRRKPDNNLMLVEETIKGEVI